MSERPLFNPFERPDSSSDSGARSTGSIGSVGTGPKPISPNSAVWYRIGELYERLFVKKLTRLGIECLINPDKRTNKKLPDLIINGRLAELKTQVTHFYNSEKLYQIPPEKVITINLKDIQYYQTYYPDLDIYVWLYKEPFRNLPAMDEVWFIHFQNLLELCETAPRHVYAYRKGVARQAKSSYVLSTAQGFVRIA